MVDFTIAGSLAGLDRSAVLGALGYTQGDQAVQPRDQVVAAVIELRSGEVLRIHAALRDLPRDPIIIAALVPLLARDQLVPSVVPALASFGARAAGELVAVLLDPTTPDVVRRRVPRVLRSCPSIIARDGLRAGLEADTFEIRLRCGRALLALTDDDPDLHQPFPQALMLAQRELGRGGQPQAIREHVFNLLALALERELVRIAARAFATDDVYVRGTALEYLETVLPSPVFTAFRPLLTTAGSPPVRRRMPDVRAELLKAGNTMTVSLDEVRRQLDIAAREDT